MLFLAEVGPQGAPVGVLQLLAGANMCVYIYIYIYIYVYIHILICLNMRACLRDEPRKRFNSGGLGSLRLVNRFI